MLSSSIHNEYVFRAFASKTSITHKDISSKMDTESLSCHGDKDVGIKTTLKEYLLEFV